MRMRAGDQDGAVNAATLGATSSSPNSASTHLPILLALQLMISDVVSEQNKTTAQNLVKNYLNSPGAKPEVQLEYARVLAQQGSSQDALKQLEQLTQRERNFSDGWLALGSMYASQGQTAQARTALLRYLDVQMQRPANKASAAVPDVPDPQAERQRQADIDAALLLLAQLAKKSGDTRAADQYLEQVQSPGQMLAVAVERASLIADQGRLEEGLTLIRNVPERGPDDAMLKIRAQAQLLREHQRPNDAYTLLITALQSNSNDKELMYDAAMAATKAGLYDEEEKLLRQIMVIDPQSAVAYNALGYDLADRGVRLDEAKKLIEKAVSLAPADAFIRDSLGWVNFKMGNLVEARRILENAFRQQPDAEIAAHLGEVIWAQGDRDAARSIWQQGLLLDSKNETLQKTINRLKAQLP
jgi:predicted Zn-dependent protease